MKVYLALKNNPFKNQIMIFTLIIWKKQLIVENQLCEYLTNARPSLFFWLTRGTKAFHYTEEKKTKVIYLVAASEK